MRRMRAMTAGSLELEEQRLLLGADAVLAGDGAAEGDALLEHLAQGRLPHRRVGLEDRHVDVAVAGVAAAGHPRPALGRRSRRPWP